MRSVEGNQKFWMRKPEAGRQEYGCDQNSCGIRAVIHPSGKKEHRDRNKSGWIQESHQQGKRHHNEQRLAL